MSFTKDTIEEWLESPVTQSFRSKVTESLNNTLMEKRFEPEDIKGRTVDIDVVAMYNAYKQGQIDALLEFEVMVKEMIAEDKGEDDDAE